MSKSTTIGAPFLCYPLPSEKKSKQGYILGLKKLTPTIDMTYILDHVQMNHPFLKEFTSLSHTYQWLALTPFVSSLEFHI